MTAPLAGLQVGGLKKYQFAYDSLHAMFPG